MNSAGIEHRRYRPGNPARRLLGWAVVVLVHVALGWALVTGTTRQQLESTRNAMQASVIQEVIVPPPPPPPAVPVPEPRKITRPRPMPRTITRPRPQPTAVTAAPPPSIPMPEVQPPVSSGIPMPSVPTHVAAGPPAAAAGAGAGAESGTDSAEIGVACPVQVAPGMPRKALRQGTEGTVSARVLIRDGAVREVTILSGPEVFHSAVRAAMLQYRCVSGPGDVFATQRFVFEIKQ